MITCTVCSLYALQKELTHPPLLAPDIDYFGSLGKTSFTLFQCMTIAGWPDIAREVMLTYPWAWVPFVTWILLSKFTMVQLIIAILCQSLAHVNGGEADEETDVVSSTENDGSEYDVPDDIARLEAKIEMLTRNIDALMHSGRVLPVA